MLLFVRHAVTQARARIGDRALAAFSDWVLFEEAAWCPFHGDPTVE
jgi:hypothetical protein